VQRYSREICEQVEGGPRKVWEFAIDKDGLEPAATHVLEQIQKVLCEREADIGHFAAFNLYWQQRWCLNALLHLHSHKFAKQTQIRLAGGRPLTICVGTGKGRKVKTILSSRTGDDLSMPPRLYRVTGGGCYRVFEDTLQLQCHMWLQWCPECAARKPAPIRSEARALMRRHAQIAALLAPKNH
jgi:hypothetical protein